MYYRPILKKSFDIVIRHKFLWALGFFAAFLGNGGVYDVLWRGWKFIVSGTTEISTRFTPLSFSASEWASSYNISPWWFFVCVFFALILAAGFVFVVIGSQGGLIFATKKIAKRGKTDLKESFKEGVKNFWQLLSLNLFGRILIFVLLFLAAAPVFLNVGGRFNFIFSFLFFIVFVPLALAVSFSVIYGLISVVLEKSKIREAFHKSLELFKNKWLQSLEFALILLGINLALALALAFLFIIFFLPFLILGTGFYLLFGLVGLWVNLFLFILLCVLFFILFGSIYGAFQIVAWTLFYLEITKRGVIAKVVRLLKKVIKR